MALFSLTLSKTLSIFFNLVSTLPLARTVTSYQIFSGSRLAVWIYPGCLRTQSSFSNSARSRLFNPTLSLFGTENVLRATLYSRGNFEPKYSRHSYTSSAA